MSDARELPVELAEALVAGQLAEQDAEAVAQALSDSEEAERVLAGVLLVHGLLAGSRADPEEALAAIQRRLAAETGSPSRRRRRLLWAAGVAAALLLAAGVALFFALTPPPGPIAARLVSGRPDGLPLGVSTVTYGQAVSASKAVELVCEEGSRVAMAPGSTLTIEGMTESDRWRIVLARGEVRCTVPSGEHPFRVRTAVADVVTEGTEFTVRLGGSGGGPRGMAVAVAEGKVRVEQPGLASVRVEAGGLRLFPKPSDPGQAAALAMSLLFPGERVQGIRSKQKGGVIEAEAWIQGREVEVELTPDGAVRSYGRELAAEDLPERLPPAVRRAVEMSLGPDVAWLEAERETRGGVTTYGIVVRARGRKVELDIDADGRVIHKEEEEHDRD